MEAQMQSNARSRLGIRGAFRLDTAGGWFALLSAVIVLATPSLAYFVSDAFLVLLAVALVLSLLAVPRLARAREERITRIGQAGYAMAFNGVLLIVGLFFVGFLGDFFLEHREGLQSDAVGLGFTTVHILLGVGLLLVDSFRHVKRADI